MSRLSQRFTWRLAALAALGVVIPSLLVADIVQIENVSIQGSLCVGVDCVNGESFGFDTLRLKENNLRIRFQDTSNSADFPGGDWRVIINDNTNGGGNFFAVEDSDNGRVPFKLESGAPNNALLVDDAGRIGLSEGQPVVELHMADGDTPTIRLEQDGSSGFTEQTWDVAGNETNFFLRDVTNNSALSFRVKPGAPQNSLYMDADGDIGFGTTQAPQAALHVVRQDSPSLRLEQGDQTFAAQVWDLVANDVNLAFRDVTGGSKLPFRLRPGAPSNSLTIDSDGDVGLGTAGPMGALHVRSFEPYDPADVTRGQLVLENGSGGDTTTITQTAKGRVVNVFRDRQAGSTWLQTWGLSLDGQGTAMSVAEVGKVAAMTLTGTGDLWLAGSISQGSSRAIKSDIETADEEAILRQVDALKIATWRYTADRARTQHIGPMAEDFHEAFGVGRDAAHLSPGDAAGVSLAATKALSKRLKAQQRELSRLRRENAALKSRLGRLESLADRLAAQVEGVAR